MTLGPCPGDMPVPGALSSLWGGTLFLLSFAKSQRKKGHISPGLTLCPEPCSGGGCPGH